MTGTKDELKKVKWNRVALNIKRRLKLRDQKTFVNHQFTIVRTRREDLKVIKAGSMTCGFKVGEYAGHRWIG